jgi:hypothetical protein
MKKLELIENALLKNTSTEQKILKTSHLNNRIQKKWD